MKISGFWPFDELKPRHYRTLVIDPPYSFAAGTKSRPQHYARMTDAAIAALSIGELRTLTARTCSYG